MSSQFKFAIVFLILTVASGLLVVNTARADSIYIGQISDHFNSDTKYRERHPLVVYEIEDEEGSWIVGWWKNSYNRHTYAIGAKVPEARSSWGEVGYKIGLATGYRVPVFATLYYQNEYLDINWLPGEMVSAGLRFHF